MNIFNINYLILAPVSKLNPKPISYKIKQNYSDDYIVSYSITYYLILHMYVYNAMLHFIYS